MQETITLGNNNNNVIQERPTVKYPVEIKYDVNVHANRINLLNTCMLTF